jgi:multiple antibiotic resistance protein
VSAPGFALTQVFTFLFLMLGPFKVIEPFAAITRDLDARQTRQIAIAATLFASVALTMAALLGESILERYGIPVPVLALSGGTVLLLVALRGILEQFQPAGPRSDAATDHEPPNSAQRAMHVAFPAIVTPYGIAALVVFVTLSVGFESRLMIGAGAAIIMLLNLIVMLFVGRLLAVLRIVLPVLGAVLGVVQVALGLQIICNSLRAMGLT